MLCIQVVTCHLHLRKKDPVVLFLEDRRYTSKVDIDSQRCYEILQKVWQLHQEIQNPIKSVSNCRLFYKNYSFLNKIIISKYNMST